MESLRNNLGIWVAVAFFVLIVGGVAHIYITSPLHGLSPEERADVDEFYDELAELEVGDFVNMVVTDERPGNVTVTSTETFAVDYVHPNHGYVYLEGPGPQSRSWNKRRIEFEYAGPKNLYDAYNRVTSVVHRGDPGHEQLAGWYYTQ